MIIHDIRFDGAEILVGVTDEQRWEWEIKDGASGADAKTLVYVLLTDHGPGHAVSEQVGLHLSRGDPLRSAAIAAIPALLEIAWRIKDKGWNEATARSQLFGEALGRA
jgi:hypothetical protein